MITAAILSMNLLLGAQTPAIEVKEIKIPDSLASFKIAKIPAGKITIGDKTTEVKSIWVCTTEVTWDVYDIYAYRLDLTPEQVATGFDAKSRPSKPYGAPDRGYGHAGYAALGPAINACQKYCDWLNKKTGMKFRMPTEAEWEYAARAGATTEPSPIGDYAWYWDNSDGQTQPVGKKKPNAWGLYDVLGNTQEWVIGADGKPTTCGGSFTDKADKITFNARAPYDPMWQDADAHVPKSIWWLSDGDFVGFRVVSD